MKRWMRIGAGAAGALAVGAVGALAVGGLLWSRATARTLERLMSVPDDGGGQPVRYAREQLDGLPAPVVRYFEFALTEGQPRVQGARLLSAGDFLARPPDGWSPFTAEQHFSVQPRGFVWDAEIRMMPLVPVRVRDGYVAGAGSMHGELGGLVTLVDQRDTPEMAAGSLLRWLAECAWLPTALLPSPGLHWEALDERSARVVVVDGATTVSLDVHFGDQGEIARVWALRHRDVDGTPVLTPWEGTFADYQRVDGMMVPMSGEVSWLLPEGRLPYWRGRILSARYTTW